MSEIQIYDNGDRLKIYATFTPSDPVAVQFEMWRDGVYAFTYEYGVDAEVTRLSEGAYVLEFDIPSAGYWRYKVIGTGTVQAVETWFFIARS